MIQFPVQMAKVGWRWVAWVW